MKRATPAMVGQTMGCAMAVMMLATSGTRAAAAGADDAADVAAITAIENRLAGQTSPAAIAPYFTPDARVLDYLAPGIHKGTQPPYAPRGASGPAPASVSHRIMEINVASDGHFACDALELHLEAVLPDGHRNVTELRKLDVFRKVGDRWLITQEQVSVPADIKTGLSMPDGPLPVRGTIDRPADPFPGPAVSASTGRAEILDWTHRALRVTGIGPAMKFYGPGNDVLLYGEFAPGQLRGKDEIRAYYAPVMGSYDSIDVGNPVLAVDSDGRLGAQIDTQVLRLHMKDGTTRDISLRQSDCLRRVGGTWYSFFEMVSFPMEGATGKAQMTPDKAVATGMQGASQP